MRSRWVGALGWLGIGRHPVVGVLVLMGAFLFGGVSSAWAGVSFGVSPHLGGPLKVGNTGIPSSLTITNTSTGAEASQNLTLSTISLVPACGTKTISGQDCPAASVDPGVLRVSVTGSGQPGSACAGMTFSTSVVDAGESKYQFSPSGPPVVLGPTGGPSGLCIIAFTVDVLKTPTKDADPASGVQTDQIGSAAGQAGDAAIGSGFGTSQVTIAGSSTTSVYWDGNGNLAADPNPFAGTSPGGVHNVTLGQLVLHSLTTGHDNVASGFQALQHDTTGGDNLATGTNALLAGTSGNYNVASGYAALSSNTTGSSNVAVGTNALDHGTGSTNTAVGTNALLSDTTGASNVALGNSAGRSLTTGSNNIDIANAGVAAEASTIRIGTPGTQSAAFLAGVNGITIPGPSRTVVINANGQLGTATALGHAASIRTPARTAAQVRRQQHEIDRLGAENRRLQNEIDQLHALLTHRH